MSSDDLAATVKALEDTRQIVRALNLYGLAIDSHRYEFFAEVFAPDVQADYNPPIGWSDCESLARDMKAFHAPLDGSLHRITNHQVMLDGDRANSISYVDVRLVKGADEFGMGGFYDDTFERRPEGWRIKKRFYRGSWWHGNPRILADTSGFVFEPITETLRQTHAEGRVAFLTALTQR
jgi:hypothetical protein